MSRCGRARTEGIRGREKSVSPCRVARAELSKKRASFVTSRLASEKKFSLQEWKKSVSTCCSPVSRARGSGGRAGAALACASLALRCPASPLPVWPAELEKLRTRVRLEAKNVLRCRSTLSCPRGSGGRAVACASLASRCPGLAPAPCRSVSSWRCARGKK